MRNVQVGQGVRAVLATDEQLADVVRFCSNPEEYGIFGIDITYNIGDFYVTTTTYKHLSLIDKATGNHPVFPGPMMVHTDEKQETFHYFASTMREVNSDIENILFVGSDRQRSIENGLAPQLPIVHFLVCKKHVEDNIKMKMAALGIQEKANYLIEIFGDRTSRGLIDSESREEFESRLLQLKDVWENRPTGDEFYTNLVAHIAEDMKCKMILPIRRTAGLGDKFFNNNSTESINSSLKSEVEQSKHATAPGKPSKCSHGKFVSIAEEFVNRYRRNVHRGVVGDGPYKLSQNYQHAAVTEDKWKNMTKKEKAAKISIVDPVGYKKLLTFAATGISTSTKSGSGRTTPPKAPVLSSVNSELNPSENLPDFESSGLPQYLRGSWEKARDIIIKNGVTKINDGTNVVVSITNPRKPHIVNYVGSRSPVTVKGFRERLSVRM